MGDALDPQYRPPEHLRPQVRRIAERMLAAMRVRARQEGWGLSVHGSLERDLDVIAVPWTPEATSENDFLTAMQEALGTEMEARCFRSKYPTFKPHGRRSYTLYSGSEQLVFSDAGMHPFVDMSIMDIRNDFTVEEEFHGDATSD